jgi:phage gpG-like protein
MTTGVTVKMIDRDGLQVAIKQASAPPNSRILAAVASRMRGMQMKHFKEQKDSAGKAWDPLKPGTLAARKRRRTKARAEAKIRAKERAEEKAKGGKDEKKEKKKTGEKKKKKDPVSFVEKILQDRGRLRTSIVRYSNRDTAITGTNTIYAATHQFGREGGGWQGSDIPAREFIYLNAGEQKELVDFVSNEIIGPLMKRKN